VKQAVKTFIRPLKNEFSMGLLNHVLVLLLSFIAARASVMSKFTPFGSAMAAGVPKSYILTAGIGAAAGYIFPASGFGGFRYIAAVFAISAIRVILAGVARFDKSPFWSALIAFSVVLLTSVAVSLGDVSMLPLVVAEALLSAGGAYFINRASQIRPNEKPGLLTQELVSVCFAVGIIILGLIPLQIDGVSFGRMAGVVIVLTAARFGGAPAGVLCGVMLSFICAIGSVEYNVSIPVFAAGGLFAGFFSAFGKTGTILGFFATALLACILSGELSSAAVIGIECVIASGVFLLLPKSITAQLGNIFLGKAEMPSLSGVKGALVMRLEFASGALKDVSSTVEEVSKELSRINSPDFDTVLKRVENSACRGCSLCVHCWETQKSETVEAVLGLSSIIRQPDKEPKESVPKNFLGRCLRFDRFTDAVSQHYSDYISKINAENRIEEVRSVVSDQFDGISNMLYDLSNEFRYAQQHDPKATESIVMTLRSMNINAVDCAAATDRFGRLSADIKVKLESDTVLNKKDIMKRLSAACDRDFDIPCITKTEKEAFISLTEKAIYYAEIGVTQFSAGENAMCGDSCEHFLDGKGHLIMLLSDGMGNGGRAAVDSAMVTGLMSRLIKSGFGFDCSLKIANSSMLFKSTDESLATVDIVSIDLFTGVTELYKAGAAPTIVRRQGRTAKAESTSLPAGILREVGFDRAEIKIKKDDIVVMMSDGVVNDGTEWICAEIEAFEDGSAQQLADKIANSARRRRSDNHEDDITVMTAILRKLEY